MLISFLLLIGLLAVLVKSSDFFVESVARIATYLGVSEFVIGLTVIAIGTSLPELGSSVMAAFENETELAVGNIVGSNLANIGLILGLSSFMVSLKTSRQIFFRDCTILLGITATFFIFAFDGTLSNLEGMILLGAFPIYLAYLFGFDTAVRSRLYDFRDYLENSYGFNRIRHPGSYKERLEEDLRKERYDDFVGKGFDIETYHGISNRLSVFKKGLLKDLAITLVSAFMIYLSSRYLVPASVEVAGGLGVTENVIGATLIALGTSLPELSVSLSAAKKGMANMILGNVIGSNLFNILLVGGTSASIAALNIIPLTMQVSLPLVLLITGLLFVFVRTNWRVGRYEGLVLLFLYALFITLLVFGGLPSSAI